jgi:hypothetical protein
MRICTSIHIPRTVTGTAEQLGQPTTNANERIM